MSLFERNVVGLLNFIGLELYSVAFEHNPWMSINFYHLELQTEHPQISFYVQKTS